ncbi:hypothetical protein FRC03_007936 [Tulasnella sp. 419]|nr:hypothetical protein FRC03_007936 [Tulasnella sp. 419]
MFPVSILSAQGQSDKARVVMEEARNKLLELGGTEQAACILYDIGQTYGHEPQTALPLYEQARSEFISIGNRYGSLRCLASLGASLSDLGEYDAAQSALEEARLGFIELGDRYSVAYSLFYMNRTFSGMGNHSLSLVKLEEALELFTQIGHVSMMDVCSEELLESAEPLGYNVLPNEFTFE